MKSHVLIPLMAIIAITYAETYTDKYDSTNVQELINNKRILYSHLDCVLDKGRCTPEAKELKSHMGDAIQTGCKKCTDKQKEGAKLVMEHIRKNEPKYWEELTAKYDPNNEYKENYEAFLAGKL